MPPAAYGNIEGKGMVPNESPQTPASRIVRCLTILCLMAAPLLPGCVIEPDPSTSDVTHMAGARPPMSDSRRPVETAEACFRVKHEGGRPFDLRASMFRVPESGYGAPAVILVHGGQRDRTLWDGGPAGLGLANETTLPRVLARLGYTVFAVDRAGFGASTYGSGPGSMAELTVDANLQHFVQVVRHVKAGTYRYGSPACEVATSQGHDKV
ncbi:MAG TPA: hypothetical protein VI818_05305, partial [Candidatus Thermoplasmatota archaeon]|nr:hypothetical protein [Candidatus Thermoplasmatota archaeon]